MQVKYEAKKKEKNYTWMRFAACRAGLILTRVLSIFLTKIMAAIFDFNGSGRKWKKEICTKGAVDSQKQGEE